MIIYKNAALEAHGLSFHAFMQQKGELFRVQKERQTQRIQIGKNFYFIKQHNGIGWREIFKNIGRLVLPVLGAKNEWVALSTLTAAGLLVPKPYIYGRWGLNVAKQKSFILMEALENTISLETLTQTWRDAPPVFAFKQALIQEVARITRVMHHQGINHRDCYLCHFLLASHTKPLKIYLIDLHRAQYRRRVPTRWMIKDLAGLYFSSKDCGLTQRDLLRFVQSYYGKPLRTVLKSETQCLRRIWIRGEKLYRDHLR